MQNLEELERLVMAKIRRRKRKVSKLWKFSVFLFSLALLSLLASSLIVGTFNTSITIDIQKMNNEIEVLKNENEKLNIEISSLQNKDRVYVIAKDAGLNQNQDNIISIQGEK